MPFARKTLPPLLLILLSLSLAWLAKNVHERELLSLWMSEFEPDLIVFQSLIEKKGYQKLPPGKVTHELRKNLPGPPAAESFWITEGRDWILMKDGALYSLISAQRLRAESWTPLGQGLNALKNLTQILKKTRPNITRSIRGPQGDPREIRY